jgi:DNA-binding NarL/FixJ family response regulator
MHDDNIYVTRALQAGAYGSIAKTEASEILLRAVNKILNGTRYISHDIAQDLIIHKGTSKNTI